jgi:hypothetical protein
MLLIVFFYLALPMLFGADRRTGGGAASRGAAGLLLLFLAVVLALGWYFGWRSLEPRMEQLGEGYQDREAIYALHLRSPVWVQ